jgi:competence protein ComEC
LLSGLVTGDDTGFSRARQEAFNSTGTTHLTAVSGSNLALVAGILAAIGGATVGRHRVGWQVATVGGVWAYAAITGAEAPALRAAIVATAAILAFRVGRRPDFVTLVVLAAGAMALLDPGRVESLGFRLSVAASLALALVLPPLMERGGGSGLAVVLAATAAAQIATLPILLPVFGTVPLTSLPANIIAAPLAAIAMPLAGLAGLAGFLWPPLAEPLAAPAVLAANLLIAAVDVLGAPDASVSVGVPPILAAAAIAVTAAVLLAAFLGSAELGRRSMRAPVRLIGEEPETGRSLATTAPLVLAREDPAHALAADLDDAEEDPAGEEDGYEVPDVRNLPETVP